MYDYVCAFWASHNTQYDNRCVSLPAYAGEEKIYRPCKSFCVLVRRARDARARRARGPLRGRGRTRTRSSRALRSRALSLSGKKRACSVRAATMLICYSLDGDGWERDSFTS